MGRIIGIDLGTTTSEIAYIKNGKPEIIHNDLGSRITPSVVGVSDDGELIIGEMAKRQAPLKPDKTVVEIKRKMGTNAKVSLGEKQYYPFEISAILLKKLKEYAEDNLGEKVTEAVITVPANFDDLQRQATKKAGEAAGLVVDRIINEPTAAALAYGINNLEADEKVLVYDLGGGTFDVTVLELFEGVLDVKASRGNNFLGGKDFDERIIKYVLSEFKRENGIDLTSDSHSMARIKEAAEKAKIDLSSMDTTYITIPFIAVDKNRNPLAINTKLSRNKFEELIRDLVQSTESEIEDALKAAGYKINDIDVVIAVGGSSRVPCIKNLLKKKFGNKVKAGVNPDEAVALGAAIQAGIKNDEVSSEDSIIITDACRYTMGISIIHVNEVGRYIDGVFSPILIKDSKVPCTASDRFVTVSDNQTAFTISVYQGDNRFVVNNTKIGEFVLEGVPEAPAGEEQLEVEFSYNLNGILEVKARIVSTGKYINRIIDTMAINDKDNISNNSAYAEKWLDSPYAAQVKTTIELCEAKMLSMNDDDKEKVAKLLRALKEAVVSEDKNLINEYDEALTDVLFELN